MSAMSFSSSPNTQPSGYSASSQSVAMTVGTAGRLSRACSVLLVVMLQVSLSTVIPVIRNSLLVSHDRRTA